MPSRTLGSPMLMAFLRALAFVGITESLFYRLMPPPPSAGAGGLMEQIHLSLYQAGNLTFFFAFFLVMVALVTVAYRTLSLKLWPGATNGFVAVCVLCMAALGFSTLAMARGPVFAIGFTILALLTVLFVAMQAYAGAASGWARAFAVCYGAAVLSSAVGTIARFAEGLERFGSSGDYLVGRSVGAGEFLLAAAGALSFLAFHEFEIPGAQGAARRGQAILPVLLGASAAVVFAVGSLMAPPALALLGPGPGAVRVTVLSAGLFLGTMTTVSCLLDPRRRLQGYGLLLMLLAGFPLRIAYQHMTAVLGTVLLFSPQVVDRTPSMSVGYEPRPEPAAAEPPPQQPQVP